MLPKISPRRLKEVEKVKEVPPHLRAEHLLLLDRITVVLQVGYLWHYP